MKAVVIYLTAFFFGVFIGLILMSIHNYNEKETERFDRAVTDELIRICIQDQNQDALYCIRELRE